MEMHLSDEQIIGVLHKAELALERKHFDYQPLRRKGLHVNHKYVNRLYHHF